MTLVRGLQHAVAAGIDVQVDLVGSLGEGPEGALRWAAFEEDLLQAGMADRVHLHGHVPSAVRAELLAGSDVVLWIGRSLPGAGLPEMVVEATAANRCVIASAVPELTWCPAIAEHVTLVAPGDGEALAAALVGFAGDRGLALQKLHAGRVLLVARAAEESSLSLPLVPDVR